MKVSSDRRVSRRYDDRRNSNLASLALTFEELLMARENLAALRGEMEVAAELQLLRNTLSDLISTACDHADKHFN